MPLSIERLVFGHSLLSNKYPKGAPLAKLSDLYTGSVDHEQFGLFDSSANNFNNFFPDITAEDLQPKDEDFVYPVFRALSEVIVNKWGPIDFSSEGVLKRSLNKLKGQTIYPNHEVLVGNELGVVIETAWQDATTTKGVKVPAGINAKFKLDGKTNPKIARNVMSDPPVIHSTSVGVEFEWVPSHKFKDEREFYEKLGTYTKDGELVRRVVSEVRAFHEISFVPHGADPYAQKVNENGEINDPKYAASRKSFNNDESMRKHFFFDYKDTSSLQFSALDENFKSNNNNTPKMNKILELLNLAADSDEAAVVEAMRAIQANLATLTSTVSEKDTKITQLQGQVDKFKDVDLEQLQADAKIATQAIEALKADTQKFYALSVQTPEEGITNLINSADYKTLTVLNKQYKTLAESKHSMSCTDCGSTNVTRASSKETEGGQGATPTNLSNYDIAENIKKSRLGKASLLHL